jgi:hypothetical protein
MLAKSLLSAIKGKGKGKGQYNIQNSQNSTNTVKKLSGFTDYKITLYHLTNDIILEIIEKVKTNALKFPEKYLMMFIKDNKFYGFVKENEDFKLYELVNDLEESHFRTNANTAEIEEQVANNCMKLSGSPRMEVNFGNKLKAGMTKSYASHINILTISNRSLGTYFDLVGLIVVNGTLQGSIYYRKLTNQYVEHSGDKMINGFLEHKMNIKTSMSHRDVKLIIVVCGYKNTPLYKFENQQPTILVTTEYTRGVSIKCDLIPIELTINNLGNACAAGIAVFDFETSSITVLEKPVLVENANTDDFNCGNSMTENFTMKLMTEYNAMNKAQLSSIDSDNTKLNDNVEFEQNVYKNIDMNENRVVILKENGTTCWTNCPQVKTLTYSDCFGISNSDRKYPIATGTVTGASALFATPNGNIEFGSLNVIIVSEFSQDLMSNSKFLINGIFIIDTGNKDWENTVSSLNFTGLCMCGGMSMVLIKNNDRLYFFRGSYWNGIIDELPEIFADVTEMVTQLIIDFNEGNLQVPFPTFIHREDNAKYCICDEMQLYTLKQLLSITETTQPYVLTQYNNEHKTFDECLKMLYNIAVQITLVVSEEKELSDSAGMIDHIKYVLEEQNKMYSNVEELEILRGKVQELVNDETITNTERKKSMKKLLNKIRMIKSGKTEMSRKIDEFLSENMYRICGQSTFANAKSSKQRIRSVLIAEAYNANKNKTIAEYLENNEERVPNLAILMCNPTNVNAIVHSLGDGNESNYNELVSVFNLSDRMPIADNLTVSCLYESSTLQMRDVGFHICEYNDSIALPLPILSKKITENFKVNWTELVKDDTAMFFGQKFRQAVSEYGSQNGVVIESSSIYLAKIFMGLCIRSMETIAEKMTVIPTTDESPSSMVLAMRSMMYHVFLTCASTTATITPLYKLAYSCVSDDECFAYPKEEYYWVLDAIAKYFKYCVLPENYKTIKDHFKRIIVKIIVNKYLKDDFMRIEKEKKEQKQLSRQNIMNENFDPVKNWQDSEDIIYEEFSNSVSSIFSYYYSSQEMAKLIKSMYENGKVRYENVQVPIELIEEENQSTEVAVIEQIDPIMKMIGDDMLLCEVLTKFRNISTVYELPSVVITMMEELGIIGYQTIHTVLVSIMEVMIIEMNDNKARSAGYLKFCELIT